MSNTYRIGKNTTPNFYQDNTGRTINQAAFGVTTTSGTVSISPTAQISYINFENAATGNIALSINATASQICDELFVMFNGGASPYVVTFAGNVSNTSATFSLTANKTALYQGVFNGTNFIGTVDVQA